MGTINLLKTMISEKLKTQLGEWQCLYPFFEKPEWVKIKDTIRPDIEKVTPDVDNWFKAFRSCPPDKLKVVWLGMSPYFTVDPYTKALTADGLAFSTDTKHSVPPSLFKIYKGMEGDLWNRMNLEMQRRNNLDFLAAQGILLLNSALTTVLGDSKIHLEVWKPFILEVITVLNRTHSNLLFTGFGANANALLTRVDKLKHTVIELEHPAASAYASRDWEHQNLFSRTNEFLLKQNKETILWDNYLVELEVPF